MIETKKPDGKSGSKKTNCLNYEAIYADKSDKCQEHTLIDNLTFTVKNHAHLNRIIDTLDEMLSPSRQHLCGGSEGYNRLIRYYDWHDQPLYSIESEPIRANTGLRIDIKGYACNLLKPNHRYVLYHLLNDTDATITRLDIACDTTKSIKALLHDYSRGHFDRHGKRPKKMKWPEEHDGITYYIGADKQIAIYQYHGLSTVRVELRLRNTDRAIIPYDSLLKPDNYYAGHNHALQRLIPTSGALKMPKNTKTKQEQITDSLFTNIRNQYGKKLRLGIDNGTIDAGMTIADLLTMEHAQDTCH